MTAETETQLATFQTMYDDLVNGGNSYWVSNALIQITSIKPQGSDILVAWQAGPEDINVVEVATNLSTGFGNASANIPIPTSGTTNHFDAGALTTSPARFYRVKLVP